MLRPFLKIVFVMVALAILKKFNVDPTLALIAYFISEFELIHQRLEAEK